MSLFTTMCHAIEHKLTMKHMGGYEKAAKIAGNINLLHKIQDSNVCPSHFFSLEDEVRGALTLSDILNDNNGSQEIDLTSQQQQQQQQ